MDFKSSVHVNGLPTPDLCTVIFGIRLCLGEVLLVITGINMRLDTKVRHSISYDS